MMQLLRSLLLGIGILALVGFGVRPTAETNAQGEDTQATISSLQTEVAALQTMVALQTEVAGLRVELTPGAESLSTPAAEEMQLLYQADWSNGMNGWSGPQSWKAVGGMVVNDGTHQGARPFLAPYQLNGLSDYVIEAEIQFDELFGETCFGYIFGLAARAEEENGYVGGVLVHWDNSNCTTPSTAGIWAIEQAGDREYNYAKVKDVIDGQEYDPGTDWHTYRLEVEANTLRLFIDDILVAEGTDNRYLDAGRVGLWSHDIAVNVRSFRVIALKTR